MATDEERRARPAPPLAPRPNEVERCRDEIARAEAAARWERGVREHGLLSLMQIVEQRLVELAAFLPELARRRALAPRLVALAQDCLDLELPRALRHRIEALHRQVMAEPALVHNAIPARRLLDDIRAYSDFGWWDENPNLYLGWRKQLGWHIAPLPGGGGRVHGQGRSARGRGAGRDQGDEMNQLQLTIIGALC
jgi:hypothetical protein